MCRTFPRDVVYAPEAALGLGVFHPWHNQHLSQLQVVLQETNLPSITGDLIRASLEQIRLELGLSGRSDQLQWSVIDCLATNCWLKDLLQYAANHDLCIEDTLPTLRTYRAHDQFLIESFITSGYRKQQLKTLNKCRKALQVTTLAEITSADGIYLETWAWQGTHKEATLNSYQWPRRPPLMLRHWSLWQQAVQSTFLHLLSPNERKLRQPLGAWDEDVGLTGNGSTRPLRITSIAKKVHCGEPSPKSHPVFSASDPSGFFALTFSKLSSPRTLSWQPLF